MTDKILSRAELVSGGLNRARRAARLLAAIEARCTYMRDESRRVVAAYLLGEGENFRRRFDQDYLASLKRTAASEILQLSHLENFAPQWKTLAPADADLRARLMHLIGQKYGLGSAILATLGGTDPDVQASYQQLFGQPLEAASGAPRPALPPSAGLPPLWQEVEARLAWINLVSGETLYRAGDPGDALYVVISGRLHASVLRRDGSEQLVAELGRGELLGEQEVLTADARSATLRAVRDSELVRLGRADLLALAQQHMELLIQINALISRRLRQQYTQPGPTENTLQTYALLPLDPQVPLAEFGRELAQAFGVFGPTVYVTAAVLEDQVEPGAAQVSPTDPRNAQIASWLSELESRFRYVLYEAAPEASEWSRRCLRQADRIVLVGRATADPQPLAHEQALLAQENAVPERLAGAAASAWQPAVRQGPGANRLDLVLLHSPDTVTISGTAAWLAPRCLRAHHHLRQGDARQMAHLARCLAGRALGLVLGGGGARGFAHIGVLRVLEEAGIPVDLVGGTSMGAIITGGVALGKDWRQMREISSQLSSPLKLFDPTLPVVSLFSSGKVTSTLHQVYGDALIEDQWTPAFCVSSNLSRSSETIYRQGPLWKAVRASMAIPGVFAPVLHDGDIQVDGAVMNNLPIDVMRELGMAGTVIGVNVMPLQDQVRDYQFGDSISGLRAALSLVNPFDSTHVPLIYGILVRVMALHEVHQEEAKRRLADIYITPPVEQYDILDFGAFEPIIEIGYQAGLEALARWKGEQQQSQPVAPAGKGFHALLDQLDHTLGDLEKVVNELK